MSTVEKNWKSTLRGARPGNANHATNGAKYRDASNRHTCLPASLPPVPPSERSLSKKNRGWERSFGKQAFQEEKKGAAGVGTRSLHDRHGRISTRGNRSPVSARNRMRNPAAAKGRASPLLAVLVPDKAGLVRVRARAHLRTQVKQFVFLRKMRFCL